MNLRHWLQRIVPFIVSIASLTWLFATLDFTALTRSVSWKVIGIVGPSLAVYGAISLWLEAATMMRLLGSPPEGFGAWTAARIKCASYLLGIVNYALGAVALTVLLRRRAGIGIGESAGIVITISSIDFFLLLALGSYGAAASASGGPESRAGIAALVIAGSFVVGLTLLRGPLDLGPLERIRSLAIFDALRQIPLPVLARVALLRFVFTLAFISVAGSAFLAFGVAVGPLQLVMGIMFVALVSALPIAVAGLGTGQLAFLYIFQGLAEREVLLAVSLMLSAGLILLRVLMGLALAREFTHEALEQARAEEWV